MTTIETTPFGRALRHWRRLRRVSQLDLATAAATTTRHVSFLETGRSRPSRDMVERLGDALAIPLRERNRLLQTAGLAPAYPEGDIATEDLAPFRRVIGTASRHPRPLPGVRHRPALERRGEQSCRAAVPAHEPGGSEHRDAAPA